MPKEIKDMEPMELAHKISVIQNDIKDLIKQKKLYQNQLKKIAGKNALRRVRYGSDNSYFDKPIMLYALRLENNFYYIGMSRDPDKRLKKHIKGKGAMWTKLYKPIEFMEIRETNSSDDSEVGLMEDQMTLEYAERYGYDRVRGGGYCQTKPRWPKQTIEQELKWTRILV